MATKLAPGAAVLDDHEEFLTPAEVQKILRISRSSMYTALANGDIPSIRIGKLLRIPRQALAANPSNEFPMSSIKQGKTG